MLTTVEIENYRGFPSFKMDGLRAVNVIVGKNNCGKTALLEAIQLLTSRGDGFVLADAAERRGELNMTGPGGWVMTPLGPQPQNRIVAIEHFFTGHFLCPDCKFEIKGNNGFQPVIVQTAVQKNPRTGASPLVLKIIVGGKPTEFPMTNEGGVVFSAPNITRNIVRSRQQRASDQQARFVGSESLNADEIAKMWDQVTVTNQEKSVEDALRILEPDLETVRPLTQRSAYGPRGGIVVGMKNQSDRSPLGSLGDGMRRLLTIATALASTKEGSLFIDEIDTGLHYSVLAEMWKLVVTNAVDSNIQVFVTTHSWDCIVGLAQFLKEHPDHMPAVAIHKIDRTLEHSVPFKGDAIPTMVQSDVDPR